MNKDEQQNNITQPDPSTETTKSPVKQKSWIRRYLTLPVVICIGLIVYIIFFGEQSGTQHIAYQRVIDSLEMCLSQQQDSLAYYRDLNKRLSTDPEHMEQVVREQYNMKRINEDIYVIE